MSAYLILFIILAYFGLLMLIARLTSRHNRANSFFDGDRSSPWFLVAFGMIGSGISAVSLVSIPGNVGNNNLYYFQFILGTIVGYLFIALCLRQFIINSNWFLFTLTSTYVLVMLLIKPGRCFFWCRKVLGQRLGCCYQ